MKSHNPTLQAKIKSKNFYRSFFLYFIPPFLTITLFAAILYKERRDQYLAEVNERLDQHIGFLEKVLENEIHTIFYDVIYHSEHVNLKNYLASANTLQLKYYADQLRIFAGISGKYNQISFFNNHAEEVIRISNDSEKFTIAPQQKLQKKYPYSNFRDLQQLYSGQVYIFPMDLNTGPDGIERPFKPILRFAAPVYDEKGVKHGVVIFSYLAENYLKHFSDYKVNRKIFKMLLLNAKGYFLKGDSPENEFGFLFPEKKERTFQNMFPDAGSRFNKKEREYITSIEGQFSFDTIGLKKFEPKNQGSGIYKFVTSPEIKDPHWKIVAYISAHDLDKRKFGLNLSILSGYGILMLLVILASWQIAFNRSQEMEMLKLSVAVSQNPASIIITDTKGNIEYVNEAFTRISGYSPQEVIGKNPRILKSGIHPERFYKDLWSTITKGDIWSSEFSSKNKRGELYWKSTSISPIKDKHGNIINYIATNQDISNLKMLQIQHMKSQQMLTSILNTIPDRVFWKDCNGVYQGCNNHFAADVGLNSPEEVVGKTDYEIKWFIEKDRQLHPDEEIIKTGEAKINYEEAIVTPAGKTAWLEMNKIPLKDQDGSIYGILCTYQYITERKKKENELEVRAKTDPLTGLYNRRYFDEKMGFEISRSHRYNIELSLVILDLDHFKKINDQYGHAMGDTVLKKLAGILKNSIRTYDTAARIGGEEFAVILPNISSEKAISFAERIRRIVEEADFEDGLKVTCSLGVSTLKEEEGLRDIFKNADQALYKAKNLGRNRVVFQNT